MGVLTNGFRDTIGVYRTYGGTALNNCYPQGTLGNYARTGMMRNITAGEGITSGLVGVPMGYADRGWIMPQAGGAISARVEGVAFSATANGLRGMPGTGAASFSVGFAAAAGQLIVSGAGSASLTISANTPLLTASISAAGSASFTLGGAGLLGAEASATGAASFTISGALTPYAIGSMSGSTVDSTTLTADAIAARVLSAAAAAPIAADVRRVNTYTVAGDGQTGSEWGRLKWPAALSPAGVMRGALPGAAPQTPTPCAARQHLPSAPRAPSPPPACSQSQRPRQNLPAAACAPGGASSRTRHGRRWTRCLRTSLSCSCWA